MTDVDGASDTGSFDSKDAETWSFEQFTEYMKGNKNWRNPDVQVTELPVLSPEEQWKADVEAVMRVREAVDADLRPEEKEAMV